MPALTVPSRRARCSPALFDQPDVCAGTKLSQGAKSVTGATAGKVPHPVALCARNRQASYKVDTAEFKLL